MPITISGSGTITGISAGGLPDGSVVAADLASSLDLTGKTVTLPSGTGGKILQVVTQQYETQTSVSQTATVHADMPFSVNITPTTSDSLMLVSYNVMGETGHDPWNCMGAFARTISGTRTVVETSVSSGSRQTGLVSWCDTYGEPGDNGSTPGNMILSMFPDSGRPSNTNQITYTPTISQNINTSFYINRNVARNDSTSYERGVSWITVMEVAA